LIDFLTWLINYFLTRSQVWQCVCYVNLR